MPGFIKTPKDEAEWVKAKIATAKSKKKDESSFTDQDWALANHIYHEMGKSIEFAKHIEDPAYVEAMIDVLEKARKKLSDETELSDEDTEDPEDYAGLREFDPEDEESSGNDWLMENDPEKKGKDYEEYGSDEDEDAHQKSIQEDLGVEEQDPEKDETSGKEAPISQEGSQVRRSRFEQPSHEDLASMRAYTRPWEQRAREAQALKSDPSKNPELARHGDIIEARNQAHGDRNTAYRQLTSSDEYKNADPIAQMEMDDKFENDWKTQKPEHLKNALQAHDIAHGKSKIETKDEKNKSKTEDKYRQLHAATKDAAIKNIIAGGGHGGAGYSLEEGMQHAGGHKGEEGTQATIKQDPASSFAMGNQDFIKQYADDYSKKAKKVGNVDDMMQYDEGSKRDISRILGEGPSKDPKFEKFFAHYHPLIGMNANKTLNRLGLDPKHPDVDMSMLHEAGMHGLIQAMNDYDHENPSKASFATHAGNKIRGLQMTAMKNQDQIPSEVRQAQKKFSHQGQTVPAAPKVDLHSMISQSKHPAAPDRADRLKRVESAKATAIRRPAGTPKPPQMPTPQINIDEDEE